MVDNLKGTICIVHDCPKANGCERLIAPEDEALILTSDFIFGLTETNNKNFACFKERMVNNAG